MGSFCEIFFGSLWMPIALNGLFVKKITLKKRIICILCCFGIMLFSGFLTVDEITLVLDFILLSIVFLVTMKCAWTQLINIPIAYILVVLCNYIVDFLCITVFRIEYNQTMPYVLYVDVFITILVLVFSIILGRLLLRFSILFDEIQAKREMACLISGNVILCMIVFLVNGWVARKSNYPDGVTQTNLILFGTYAVFTIGISLTIFKVFQKREEMEHQKKQYESLQEYTEQIETMYTNLRTFKHDYVNILVSLSGYFESKDYEGMEKYFNENILPTNQQLNRENYRLSQLSNIKEQALKGLLSSKLIYAHEIGIDVYIDIMDEIDRIHMNMIDLTRIMGIYLDNAIEAAQECEKKEIKLNIIKGEKSVTFIIVNTFVNQGDSLQQIEQYAYSTKGKNRGIGLHNVNQLVNKYENVFKETEMERGYFIQKLRIEER